MDFEIPEELVQLCADIDAFIEREVAPLEQANSQFFDHRREYYRTDWENGGVPSRAWEDLLLEVRRRADAAGFFRYALPKELGGSDGTNLGMSVVREHLATKGLGLHNDLQSEASVVGNLPLVQLMYEFGTQQQRDEFIEPMILGTTTLAFGFTEPEHGSDATWMESTARRDGDDWIINGAKRFNSGLHAATHDLVFARTAGSPGEAEGLTCFLVPKSAPGFSIPYYHWTFNMPTDHAEVVLENVRVPTSAILHEEGRALDVAQRFLHENRIRQAAAGVGMAQYCINESVAWARERRTWGKALAERQAIQWPLAELHTEAELLRGLVQRTAWHLDKQHHMQVTAMVSMANYRANRLVCNAADQAIQTHGGIGYTRAKPFEHIYRHHRRYRITEGSEEIQIRNVAGHLLGFTR